MKKSRLPGCLRYQSYKSRLRTQLRYSLGVTQLTKNELKEVLRPEEMVLKGSCYAGRTFSGALMRLPELYGGYGLSDPNVHMVCEHAKMIVHLMRCNDNTGKKIRI